MSIVAGHTHQAMAHEILGVPIIESFASGRAFGRIDLTIARDRPRRGRRTRSFRRATSAATKTPAARCADPATSPGRHARAVQRERRGARPGGANGAGRRDRSRRGTSSSSRSASSASAPIEREYGRESALGNLFADMMLEATRGADVALTNGGGLRADLPAGAVDVRRSVRSDAVRQLHGALRLTGRGARARARRQPRAPAAAFSRWQV